MSMPPHPHVYPDEQASLHVHDHTGKTSCEQGHSHMYPGVTGPPIPHGPSHIHEIRGATTFDFRHHHVYCAHTGPAVMLPCGKHTHFISFRTSFNFGHDHQVEGYVQVTPAETVDPPKHPPIHPPKYPPKPYDK